MSPEMKKLRAELRVRIAKQQNNIEVSRLFQRIEGREFIYEDEIKFLRRLLRVTRRSNDGQA